MIWTLGVLVASEFSSSLWQLSLKGALSLPASAWHFQFDNMHMTPVIGKKQKARAIPNEDSHKKVACQAASSTRSLLVKRREKLGGFRENIGSLETSTKHDRGRLGMSAERERGLILKRKNKTRASLSSKPSSPYRRSLVRKITPTHFVFLSF